MQLSRVRIKNFKSIEDITLELGAINGSRARFLIGKNGTGKSNILEALALPLKKNEGGDVTNFERLRNRNINENKIVIEFTYEETRSVGELVSFGISNIYDREILKRGYFRNNKLIHRYKIVSGGNTMLEEWNYAVIFDPRDAVGAADSSLRKYQRRPTKNLLAEYEPNICEAIDKKKAIISEWSPEIDGVLNGEINLSNLDRRRIPKPLENIFKLSGYDTPKDLDTVVEIAIGKHGVLAQYELESKMADCVNNYLDKAWREHDARICFRIDSAGVLHTIVRDKYEKSACFSIEERSKGFTQYLSFMLGVSLGVEKDDNERSRLILIDEPELHLHPSAAREMRDQLIASSGKKNIIIATHSSEMLDTSSPERHVIASKDNGVTRIRVAGSDDDILSDEVLMAAFGTTLLLELISSGAILVEGESDKIILSRVLELVDGGRSVRIIKGQGNNLRALAQVLAQRGVIPLVIVDDDEAGRKDIERLTKPKSKLCGHVFSLSKFYSGLIKGGTIEDILPSDYLDKCLAVVAKRVLGIEEDCEIPHRKPFINEAKAFFNRYSQDGDIDKAIDKLKVEISSNLTLAKGDKKFIEMAQNIMDHLRNK